MVKKFIILPLISLLFLSATPIQAMTSTNSSMEDLVDRVFNADSVDFQVDVDFEVKSEKYSQPIVAHADIDGELEDDKNGYIDLNFWVNNQLDKYSEYSGSVVITENRIYFSETGDDWYFTDNNYTSGSPSAQQISQDVEEFEDFMKEVLDNGIIKYNAETVDYVNGKLAVRYAYQFDVDAFVDYMADNGFVNQDEIDEIYDQYKNTAITGNLWVDTAQMLPVMFTLNIASEQSNASYAKIGFSILFNNFNEDVKIVIPQTASEIGGNDSIDEEYIMASIQDAVYGDDADGDGLTDEDESKIWKTSSYDSDTDGDGYNDGVEVKNGYNPNGIGKLDSDADGLSDYNEMTIHWTDRFDSDSDNDGYKDGVEIAHGYDPNGPGRWTEYSIDIFDNGLNIGINPPADHVVLGPYSIPYTPERRMLEICPRDAAEQNEINPDASGSGLVCEDAWIWIFEGDLETKQVIGDGYTSATTEQIETTHGQNTGIEFILEYSGQKVFIFKKFNYTFAVFDEKRYSNEGLPQANWDAMLDSIVVTKN